MRKYLVGALGLALALGMSNAALAANTQTISGAFSPNKVPKNTRVGGPINVITETGTTGTGTGSIKPVTRAQILFDKDFAFFTSGVKQCDASLLEGTTTAQAKAKCGSAQVGSGAGKVQIAGDPNPANTVSAQITAFNGKPKNGKPTILLHSRVDAIASTVVLTGVLRDTSKPYGKVLDVNVPVLPAASALTRFQVKVQKSFTYMGKQRKYVSAQCSHGKWGYKGIFNYQGDPSLTVSSNQACTVRS